MQGGLNLRANLLGVNYFGGPFCPLFDEVLALLLVPFLDVVVVLSSLNDKIRTLA